MTGIIQCVFCNQDFSLDTTENEDLRIHLVEQHSKEVLLKLFAVIDENFENTALSELIHIEEDI